MEEDGRSVSARFPLGQIVATPGALRALLSRALARIAFRLRVSIITLSICEVGSQFNHGRRFQHPL